jgi:hypothetical protein
MFLVGVMISMVILVVNIVVFSMSKSQDVSPTLVIIVCSVAGGCIGLPLLGFLIFHIYISVSGNTTR